MAPGLCLKHVYFWVDASDPVSAQGWVPLLDLRVSLSFTLQTMQLPSTSCPKRKPRTSLELEACAVPPGRQGNFWSVATANTDANITGHSRLPAATFLAQTWTACFLDYWKLSIFDKMIPFVLAGQLLFHFLLSCLPFPSGFSLAALLASQVCINRLHYDSRGQARRGSASRSHMLDRAMEAQSRSTHCLDAKLSTGDSSTPLVTLANWGQGNGSPFSGPWGEPLLGGGSSRQEGC